MMLTVVLDIHLKLRRIRFCTDNTNYTECFKRLAFCSWNFTCEKCVGKDTVEKEMEAACK